MDLLAKLKPYLVIGVRLNLSVLLRYLTKGQSQFEFAEMLIAYAHHIHNLGIICLPTRILLFYYCYRTLLRKMEVSTLCLPAQSIEWTFKPIFAKFCIFWICEKILKSVNLEYNMLVPWTDETNVSSTNRLMLQVFFFHKILQNSLQKPFKLILLFFIKLQKWK